MYRSTKKKVAKQAGITAIVAVGALVTGIGIAGASTNTHHRDATAPTTRDSAPSTGATRGDWRGPRPPGGTITSVSATSVTFTDRSGTSTTFSIDPSTTVTKDRSPSSQSALAVGEQVRILPSAPGSTVAKNVDIEFPSVMGRVTAIGAGSISLSDPRGSSYTVVVSNATTYAKAGATASLNDVSVGSMIFAQGTFAPGSITILDATTVGIGAPGAFHDGAGPEFPGGAPGRIGPGGGLGGPQFAHPPMGSSGLDA
ncbi:MAG: hypothetical protein HIU84_04980 [Acidobacteria bacterium]|nr:hypothetical protein [Acidobacteriota bacterium]